MKFTSNASVIFQSFKILSLLQFNLETVAKLVGNESDCDRSLRHLDRVAALLKRPTTTSAIKSVYIKVAEALGLDVSLYRFINAQSIAASILGKMPLLRDCIQLKRPEERSLTYYRSQEQALYRILQQRTAHHETAQTEDELKEDLEAFDQEFETMMAALKAPRILDEGCSLDQVLNRRLEEAKTQRIRFEQAQILNGLNEVTERLLHAQTLDVAPLWTLGFIPTNEHIQEDVGQQILSALKVLYVSFLGKVPETANVSEQWATFIGTARGLAIGPEMLNVVISSGVSGPELDAELSRVTDVQSGQLLNKLVCLIRQRAQLGTPVEIQRYQQAEKRMSEAIRHMLAVQETSTESQWVSARTCLEKWNIDVQNACSVGIDFQFIGLKSEIQNCLSESGALQDTQNRVEIYKAGIAQWFCHCIGETIHHHTALPPEAAHDVHLVNYVINRLRVKQGLPEIPDPEIAGWAEVIAEEEAAFAQIENKLFPPNHLILGIRSCQDIADKNPGFVSESDLDLFDELETADYVRVQAAMTPREVADVLYHVFEEKLNENPLFFNTLSEETVLCCHKAIQAYRRLGLLRGIIRTQNLELFKHYLTRFLPEGDGAEVSADVYGELLEKIFKYGTHEMYTFLKETRDIASQFTRAKIEVFLKIVVRSGKEAFFDELFVMRQPFIHLQRHDLNTQFNGLICDSLSSGNPGMVKRLLDNFTGDLAVLSPQVLEALTTLLNQGDTLQKLGRENVIQICRLCREGGLLAQGHAGQVDALCHETMKRGDRGVFAEIVPFVSLEVVFDEAGAGQNSLFNDVNSAETYLALVQCVIAHPAVSEAHYNKMVASLSPLVAARNMPHFNQVFWDGLFDVVTTAVSLSDNFRCQFLGLILASKKCSMAVVTAILNDPITTHEEVVLLPSHVPTKYRMMVVIHALLNLNLTEKSWMEILLTYLAKPNHQPHFLQELCKEVGRCQQVLVPRLFKVIEKLRPESLSGRSSPLQSSSPIPSDERGETHPVGFVQDQATRQRLEGTALGYEKDLVLFVESLLHTIVDFSIELTRGQCAMMVQLILKDYDRLPDKSRAEVLNKLLLQFKWIHHRGVFSMKDWHFIFRAALGTQIPKPFMEQMLVFSYQVGFESETYKALICELIQKNKFTSGLDLLMEMVLKNALITPAALQEILQTVSYSKFLSLEEKVFNLHLNTFCYSADSLGQRTVFLMQLVQRATLLYDDYTWDNQLANLNGLLKILGTDETLGMGKQEWQMILSQIQNQTHPDFVFYVLDAAYHYQAFTIQEKIGHFEHIIGSDEREENLKSWLIVLKEVGVTDGEKAVLQRALRQWDETHTDVSGTCHALFKEVFETL